MNKIIISIHPKYVKEILNGVKKYEYRTKVSAKDIGKILIYETFPTKKVIGEAEVIGILKDTPENLWNETYKEGGISKKDYMLYFKNKKTAYAYRLGKITVYKEPIRIQELGFKCAPQCFAYVR